MSYSSPVVFYRFIFRLTVDEKVDNGFLLKTNVKDKYRDFLCSQGQRKVSFYRKECKNGGKP